MGPGAFKARTWYVRFKLFPSELVGEELFPTLGELERNWKLDTTTNIVTVWYHFYSGTSVDKLLQAYGCRMPDIQPTRRLKMQRKQLNEPYLSPVQLLQATSDTVDEPDITVTQPT